MRSIRKAIVGMCAAATVGILGYTFWPQDTESAPPTLRTTADTNTTNTEKTSVSSPGIAEASASREDTTEPALTAEQLEDKYAGYQVRGFVHMHQRPLQDVVVEALMAKSVAHTSPAWTTKTDHTGRFYLKVPHNTLYDVEASFETNLGAKKRRELTNVTSEREGDKQLIEIEFRDSPDVLINVKGPSLITKAYLQKQNKRTLEGIVEGSQARFEDIDPNELYRLCVLTEDPVAPIVDLFPVFEENITKTYESAAAPFSQLTVIDKQTKERIPNAQIKLNLSLIEPTLYQQTVVTDKQGGWQGRIAKQQFTLQTSAEGYVTEITETPATIRENTTIELKKGEILTGQVVDEQQQPIPNAEVYLLDATSMSPLEYLVTQKTDNQGRFTFTNVDPNKKPPYDTKAKETFVPVAVKTGYMQPTLETITTERGNIQLQLHHPKEKLEGRIVDQQGNPVQALVEMYLESLEGNRQSVSNTPFWLEDKKESDAQGRFTWPQLPAGTYNLQIRPGANEQGYLLTMATATIPGSPLNIVLNQGVLLEGRIIAEETGQPIPNANVKLRSTTLPLQTHFKSDEQGRFKGFVPQGEGNYFMWFKNKERRGALEEEQGSYQTGQPLQIMLRKKDYMQVVVRDEVTKQPIQHCTISMNENRPNGKYGNTRTGFDRDGISELPFLHPMDLWVSARGYQRSAILKIEKNPGNQPLYVDMKKK